MPTLTNGHLNVTALQLRTRTSLLDLLAAMKANRYKGDIDRPGWGGVLDDEDRLGRRQLHRPSGGQPSSITKAESLPQRIEARLYFDRPDLQLARELDEGADARITHQLQAVDVVIAAGDKEHKQVLATSQASGEIARYLAPALRQLVDDSGGAGDSVSFGRVEGDLDADVFLWLLYRSNNDQDLSSTLRIDKLRTLNARDQFHRRVRIYDAATLTRREVLAVVSNARTTFGPVKLLVEDTAIGLKLDFELAADGSFSAFVMTSEYDDAALNDRQLFGRRLVADVAFRIIPAIRNAYALDTNWHGGERKRFIAAARDALKNV